jgi:hypothetical protein
VAGKAGKSAAGKKSGKTGAGKRKRVPSPEGAIPKSPVFHKNPVGTGVAQKKLKKGEVLGGVRMKVPLVSKHAYWADYIDEDAADFGLATGQEVQLAKDLAFQNALVLRRVSSCGGNCLFDSILAQVQHDAVFTATHLRRQVIVWVAENASAFLSLQKDNIAGVYGVPAGEGEQPHGGPFTLVEYLLHMLSTETWGDLVMIMALSMMWSCMVSVINFEGFSIMPFRHPFEKSLDPVDFLLFYNGRSHFSALCEYKSIHIVNVFQV